MIFFSRSKNSSVAEIQSKTRATVTHCWSSTHKGVARIEGAGEITVITIYATARKYIPSFVLFPTSLPRSHPAKPLLQALQIRISDRQRNVLLTHLTYFWARRYFQHSSFSELHCRLSYPSAVLCSCANEMNVQKRERPGRMQSLERGEREREKKISRVSCVQHLTSLSSLCPFSLWKHPIFTRKSGNCISNEKPSGPNYEL